MPQGQRQFLSYSPGFAQLRTLESYSNSEPNVLLQELSYLAASEFECLLEKD
jgi:hypothetical protein